MRKIKWQKDYSFRDYPKQWTGINPLNFTAYRSYVNRIKPGICGTYVSAALVHYTFKTDRDYELDMEQLLRILKPKIDDRQAYRGTFAWDLRDGLNDLLADDGLYQARFHLVSNPIVIRELSKESPLPVIVGTTRLFGSKYGNHWLLAYAFGYNQEGQLFYRTYDNHGRTMAVIPASQTLACVWLEQKDLRKLEN